MRLARRFRRLARTGLGSAAQKWGKLTDDDLPFIGGSKDKFVGRLQERYRLSKEQALRQVDEWSQSLPTEEKEPKRAAHHP